MIEGPSAIRDPSRSSTFVSTSANQIPASRPTRRRPHNIQVHPRLGRRLRQDSMTETALGHVNGTRAAGAARMITAQTSVFDLRPFAPDTGAWCGETQLPCRRGLTGHSDVISPAPAASSELPGVA